MKKIIPSEKIYINRSKVPDFGRGVFAITEVKKGEQIEKSPIIEVSENDTSNLNESILVTYFFYFGKRKEKAAVALGFGSIYNHSNKPNASYKIDPKEKTIEFTALKNIKRDEEITFKYNPDPKNKFPLWFEAA